MKSCNETNKTSKKLKCHGENVKESPCNVLQPTKNTVFGVWRDGVKIGMHVGKRTRLVLQSLDHPL